MMFTHLYEIFIYFLSDNSCNVGNERKMKKIAVFLLVSIVLLPSFTLLTIVPVADALNESNLYLEASEEWGSEGKTMVHSVCLGDVDDDGVIEVVTVGSNTQGGVSLGQLKIWSYDGTVLSLEVSQTVESGTTQGVIDCAIADVDDDGDVEIVAMNEMIDAGIINSRLLVWYWDGSILTLEKSETWRHMDYDTRPYCVAVGDVDGDGVKEIVTGGYVNLPHMAMLNIWNWDGATLTLEKSNLWVTGSISALLAVTAKDIDKDGTVEIITSGEAGSWSAVKAQLRIWSWDGTSLALEKGHEWQSDGGHTRVYSVITNDVDDDGDIEIIVGGQISTGGPWSRYQGLLYIFSWDGTTLTQEWEEWLTGEKWYGMPFGIDIEDVDGDAMLEIITAVEPTYDSYSSDVESGCIRVWSWQENTLTLEKERLWRTTENTRAVAVVVGDVDVDGVMEIVSGGYTNDQNDAQLMIWSLKYGFPVGGIALQVNLFRVTMSLVTKNSVYVVLAVSAIIILVMAKRRHRRQS